MADQHDHEPGDETAPSPITPRRGGSSDPDDLVGRDDFVVAVWRWLGNHEHLRVEAEKRVGKTEVLQLVRIAAPDGYAVIFRDVEGITTPERLVECLTQDVIEHLGGLVRVKEKMRGWVTKLGGTEIGPVTLPEISSGDWATHLDTLFEHVADHDLQLVILWDEAPWMIQGIARSSGAEAAVQVLDRLRAVRQHHRNVRWVFTGSIGFHHVLRTLRDGRSHRTAVNDMREVELPELSPEDSARLAWALLLGAGIGVDGSAQSLAKYIAAITQGVPWFIHAIVDDLQGRTQPVSRDDVDAVVDSAILGRGWDLTHYRDRLADYYGEEDEGYVSLILDSIAGAGRVTFDEISGHLAHGTDERSSEALATMLELLVRDHYVRRVDQETWTFRYELVRRAWIELRGPG